MEDGENVDISGVNPCDLIVGLLKEQFFSVQQSGADPVFAIGGNPYQRSAQGEPREDLTRRDNVVTGSIVLL